MSTTFKFYNKLSAYLICFAVAIFMPVIAGAKALSKIDAITLPNGLKIIVLPDKHAQKVVAQIWYGVGAAQEVEGTTGIAHMLEHMMFKGTSNYDKSIANNFIGKKGGIQNAATSYDFTYYYQITNRELLEHFFSFEADRMQNLLLNSEDFASEQQVVMEERRLVVEDRPERLAEERFFALLNPRGHYHHPVIGWMEDIKNYQLDDLAAWYHKWYAPNNAVIVIAGNVEAKEVKQLAEKYFTMSAKILPKEKFKTELEPLGPIYSKVLHKRAEEKLYLGWLGPTFTHDQTLAPYAITVAMQILAGGPASRLHKLLVQEHKLAIAVNSYVEVYGKYQGSIVLAISLAPNATKEQILPLVEQEIALVLKEDIKDDELKRVKNILRADHVFKRDDVEDYAEEIGQLAIRGLPLDLGDNFISKVSLLTKDNIKLLTKKYLDFTKVTVLQLCKDQA